MASKLLPGFKSSLDEFAVLPEDICVPVYHVISNDDGSVLGFVPYGSDIAEAHGAPYYCLHRCDLVDILHDTTRPLAKGRLSSKVTLVEPATVSVTLHTGEVLKADLIIGVDGIHSITRNIVAEAPVRSVSSGQAALRATVDIAQMLPDPDLRALAEKPQINVWKTTPKTHGLMDSVWRYRTNEEGDYWLGASVNFPIHSLNGLETPLLYWVHKNGRIVLIGDACHPMLIDDATVLGNLFVHITDKDQITSLLKAYESIRRLRATDTADGYWTDKTTF
ncbi:hypothetical protein DFS33DRAFT_1269884 [Desarmillaria ectypa]|nr:hypothetical protein DFS33DRAFT_1269884 [Desarmillaria ectypa]